MISTLLASAFLISADKPILNGLDPVELCKGHDIAGKTDLTYKYGLFTYSFSTEKNLNAFKGDPERWGVQIGGACGSMGPLSGRGDGTRYWVYKGRIWLFASEGCMASFQKDPANHIDADDPELKVTAEEQKAGRALLDKAIEAHGGWKAISAMKTFVWEFTSNYKTSSGANAVYTQTYGMKGPGIFYSGSTWESGSAWNYGTVTEGWSYDGRDRFALGGQELGFLQRDIIKQPILLLRSSHDTIFKAKPIAASKTGYRGSGDGVQVQMLGKTVTLILDSKSHRIVATLSRDRSAEGPYKMISRTWSAYKTVNGIAIPMAYTASFEGMKGETTTRKISSVRINDTKDDMLFEKPVGL